MSSKVVDFKLNLAGLNAVMKSDGMKSYLESAAAKVEQTAGYGYGHDVKIASYEAIGKIYPKSKQAAVDNSEHNTLLKALQAVGLPMSKE